MNAVTEPGKAGRHDRPAVIFSLLFLAVYFAASSFQGLNAYFTQDDGGNLLNMHKYWEHSLAGVLGSAFRVVTGAYRPLGGVYYFILYGLFGFNPLPFRAVCLALMLANVFLAFALLRRLSGSLEAALPGAVLIVHHPAVLELLYSSGTIYEVLCFLFYFLAVRCYLAWRQEGREAGRTTLSRPQLAGLLALTGCALDSKEMAMTLPGALLLVELIYFPPKSWSWREAAKFVVCQGRAALAAAALVVPAIAVKVLTRNPLSDDPRYAAHSLRATVEAMRAYQNFLLYGDLFGGRFSALELLALWVAMAVAAIALRSRPMKFGLGFLIGSVLPVCLISPRGGYMLYIPLMGWALYAGSLFQRLLDGLVRLAPLRSGAAVKFGALAAAAVLVIHVHSIKLAGYSALERQAHIKRRRFIERLQKVHPQLSPGSSLLLADDPLPPGFAVLLLARLAYADPTLEVDRIKMSREIPSGDELIRYDYVLAGGWELRDVRGVSDARGPVEVRIRRPLAGLQDSYTVEIPEYAGRTVDLATRTNAGNRSGRAIITRCTLDSSGRAALAVPADSPAAIQIRWVRPWGGNWMSASAHQVLDEKWNGGPGPVLDFAGGYEGKNNVCGTVRRRSGNRDCGRPATE